MPDNFRISAKQQVWSLEEWAEVEPGHAAYQLKLDSKVSFSFSIRSVPTTEEVERLYADVRALGRIRTHGRSDDRSDRTELALWMRAGSVSLNERAGSEQRVTAPSKVRTAECSRP